MIDCTKDQEETYLDQKLETAKCITYIVKLNKGKEKVPALIESGSEAHLIFWDYWAKLVFKTLDTL